IVGRGAQKALAVEARRVVGGVALAFVAVTERAVAGVELGTFARLGGERARLVGRGWRSARGQQRGEEDALLGAQHTSAIRAVRSARSEQGRLGRVEGATTIGMPVERKGLI